MWHQYIEWNGSLEEANNKHKYQTSSLIYLLSWCCCLQNIKEMKHLFLVLHRDLCSANGAPHRAVRLALHLQALVGAHDAVDAHEHRHGAV